jgi:universal stress protein E
MTIENRPSPQVRPNRPLRNVLIGTSLGEESDQVVRAGLAVARAAGARVHLVHAAPLEPLPVGFDVGAGLALDGELIGEVINQSQRKLAEQVERLGLQGSELAGAEVLTGAPYRVLADAAERTEAGLIVVGATECGPLSAELLGSTADRVLRKADCPVLIVRGELPVPPRRVLAPVDLSDLSGEAVQSGLHLLSQIAGEGGDGEVRVRMIYALSFLDALAVRQRTGGTPLEQIESVATEELRRFAEANRPEARFQVETAVLQGEPRVEILRELEERPADLVILGTHGRGGMDRLMLGSVASTISRKAPCSVLVISPGAAHPAHR